MKTFLSCSSRETKLFASKLAARILRRGPKRSGAVVLALTGELGSGKTTFVQGFLRGLGVKRGGASPTFILMRRHGLHRKKFTNVYHIDAYRIKKDSEFLVLELDEVISDPKNIVLVEWAEKIKKIISKNGKWLRFRHGKEENERVIGL